ncbi:N-terminal methionine N(alpha)-acetyltransferase NatE [Malassezia brasiliensis]|uniref:N-terminal methionine N(Alpha)-acetyltransferase NatE n=1 Tax=Malassezia brasiliensis TaxID=1821822 RepID=A0AAF0DWJ6_9BASI|nr:N-terminal methionine N(alpha)-acetyltransferase NatE [Malassezia brasiliensis]
MAARTTPPATYPARVQPGADAAPVRRAVAQRNAIALTDLTPNNLGQLRMLNAKLFPIAYSEQVYRDVLAEEVRPVCKLGLYNDIPVGNVCCRVEEGKDVAHCKVYIMTLGVLPAYRHLGLGSAMLRHVLEQAPTGGKYDDGRKVEAVYLHVHTANEAAKQFYEQFGFQVTETVPDYFKTLEPRSAWLLEKRA